MHIATFIYVYSPVQVGTTLLVTSMFFFLSNLYFFILTSTFFTLSLPVLKASSIWFPYPPLHRSPSLLWPVSDRGAGLHGNRVMFRDGGGWSSVTQLNPRRFPEWSHSRLISLSGAVMTSHSKRKSCCLKLDSLHWITDFVSILYCVSMEDSIFCKCLKYYI